MTYHILHKYCTIILNTKKFLVIYKQDSIISSILKVSQFFCFDYSILLYRIYSFFVIIILQTLFSKFTLVTYLHVTIFHCCWLDFVSGQSEVVQLVPSGCRQRTSMDVGAAEAGVATESGYLLVPSSVNHISSVWQWTSPSASPSHPPHNPAPSPAPPSPPP